jgi:hypothetical protein
MLEHQSSGRSFQMYAYLYRTKDVLLIDGSAFLGSLPVVLETSGLH